MDYADKAGDNVMCIECEEIHGEDNSISEREERMEKLEKLICEYFICTIHQKAGIYACDEENCTYAQERLRGGK